MGSHASHAGRRSPHDLMLTAGGRAPPFGDLAKCATAAGADAGAGIQRANLFARRGWSLGHGVPISPRCSSRAAVHTSRAASAFIAAMPSPTIRSGHADVHKKAVTNPAAMMARLAKASLRAERNAARVRLPPRCRWLASRKAQKRFTASAPVPVRVSETGAGGTGRLNFDHTPSTALRGREQARCSPAPSPAAPGEWHPTPAP